MDKQAKNLTIKDWALEDRPREKMISRGIGALTDAELIAILIGSGTQNETAVAISQRILNAANNNLNELGKFTLSDFTQIKGIGEAKGVTIMAALELGRRRKRAEALNRKQIASSKDVVEIFQPQLGDLPHEEFWVLLLNRANRILDQVRVSQGGITGTVVDVRVIMKAAVLASASGIILCHNHPSGNSKPSDEDLKITQKVKLAAQSFDITLLDHIVITDQKCTSLADEAML
jgi:DNA repair protein RadC